MSIKIAIVQSTVNGRWNYCPDTYRNLLRLDLDDEAHFDSAEVCVEAAKNDRLIKPWSPEFLLYPTALKLAGG